MNDLDVLYDWVISGECRTVLSKLNVSCISDLLYPSDTCN